MGVKVTRKTPGAKWKGRTVGLGAKITPELYAEMIRVRKLFPYRITTTELVERGLILALAELEKMHKKMKA